MKMPGEDNAIAEVIALGKVYGFGNLISHLSAYWAADHVVKYQIPAQKAMFATGATDESLVHKYVKKIKKENPNESKGQ